MLLAVLPLLPVGGRAMGEEGRGDEGLAPSSPVRRGGGWEKRAGVMRVLGGGRHRGVDPLNTPPAPAPPPAPSPCPAAAPSPDSWRRAPGGPGRRRGGWERRARGRRRRPDERLLQLRSPA